MTGLRVIVVDDEPALRAMVEDYLTLQGFRVTQAEGGAALDRALAAGADLILLDINMPGEDGLSILARQRGRGARMGVVMLTANAAEASVLAGLNHGADDYVAKPFDLAELAARLRAVARRLPPAPPPAGVAFGRCRLDPEGRALTGPDGAAIEISAMEFALLEVFARHPRQVLSRERLCELAHGRPLAPGERSVDIRITRLRKKIEADPANPRHLLTLRGEGYVFDPGPR